MENLIIGAYSLALENLRKCKGFRFNAVVWHDQPRKKFAIQGEVIPQKAIKFSLELIQKNVANRRVSEEEGSWLIFKDAKDEAICFHQKDGIWMQT